MLTIGAIAIGLAFVGAFLWLVHVLEPRVVHYRLDADGVTTRQLWRCRIPYEHIAGVQVVSLLDLLSDGTAASFKTWWWTGRIFGKLVVIDCHDGRAFVCGPRDADGFARAVRERIAALRALETKEVKGALEGTGPTEHEGRLARGFFY